MTSHVGQVVRVSHIDKDLSLVYKEVPHVGTGVFHVTGVSHDSCYSAVLEWDGQYVW